ncbi:GRAM domain-containing protein 2B [Xenentodon cancila]
MRDECVSQQTSQEEARKSNRGAAKHQDRDNHCDLENVTEDRQRLGRMVGECLSAAGQELPGLDCRKKPALVRSKTFDNSLLTQVQTDSESKLERKKSHYSQLSKSNSQYHKIFKEISKDEQLRQSYTCALQKDILYQGRMFVSEHWICFHSKVFGKDTKIAIPVMSITNIKKTKTAILVPNALVISTTNDRYVFVSFLSRDNTYKFLMSGCLHLKEKSPCSSPAPSSADRSFRGQRSPGSPRFPLRDFSGLDGVMRQRRQETEESSSSDSQAPDYERIAGITIREQQHKAKKQHMNQQSPDNKQHGSHHGGSEHVKNRALKPVSLNTLLIIYMFLVCVLVLSSCYLAFKIVSLEQRLMTLGSISDFKHHENSFFSGGANENAELFSELLTINLLKLEKVQKNLQRMLEEAS